MRLKEHERRAKETFGHPFTEVHRFKDSLASFYGLAHFTIRREPKQQLRFDNSLHQIPERSVLSVT